MVKLKLVDGDGKQSVVELKPDMLLLVLAVTQQRPGVWVVTAQTESKVAGLRRRLN